MRVETRFLRAPVLRLAEDRADVDPDQMRALYPYAYDEAEKGDAWRHSPPGVTVPPRR